jgi:hypothetical protein
MLVELFILDLSWDSHWAKLLSAALIADTIDKALVFDAAQLRKISWSCPLPGHVITGHYIKRSCLGVSSCKFFCFSSDLPLGSKTGIEKGEKRISVFDEMRVKLEPQPIINGDPNDSNRKSV